MKMMTTVCVAIITMCPEIRSKVKAKISKMPAPTKYSSIWLVQLPGDFWASGFAHYEQARQFVADWVDGKVR